MGTVVVEGESWMVKLQGYYILTSLLNLCNLTYGMGEEFPSNWNVCFEQTSGLSQQ